jgi:hypothetical protein
MRFLILLLLLIPCAHGLTDTILLNESYVPSNYTHSLNISLGINETANITRTDAVNLTVNFPDVVNFTNSSEQEIDFEIVIPELNLSANYNQTLRFIFETSINTTIEYEIQVFIEYDYLNIVEEIDILTVENLNYTRSISSNVLPIKGTFTYDLTGDPYETMYLNCPENDYLVCPEFKFFDENGEMSLEIGYYLPYDYGLGETVYEIEFISKNNSIKRSITFKVEKADVDFRDFVFTEDCFVRYDESSLAYKPECVEDYISFVSKAFKDSLESIRNGVNKSEYCEDYVEYEEKFVVVGEVDKELQEELIACRDEKSSVIENLHELQDDHRVLLEDIANNETRISVRAMDLIQKNNDKIEAEKKAYEEQKLKDLEAEEEEKAHQKRVFWGWFWTLTIVGLLAFTLIVSIINRRKTL